MTTPRPKSRAATALALAGLVVGCATPEEGAGAAGVTREEPAGPVPSAEANGPAGSVEPGEPGEPGKPGEPEEPGDPEGPVLEVAARPGDEALLRPLLERGAAAVEAWFGRPFPGAVRVEVLPDRRAFTESFPPEWGMTETACWMVAAGVADRLLFLSPEAWAAEACEHDPDLEHVAGIATHELVHVFHGQHNPTGDFTGAEEVGWFAEGLAVLVSGQLEREPHASAAREALESGRGPAALAEAWSGPYRYGVAGSIARFLEERCGREGLFEMLAATTQDELLAVAGASEDELLRAWEREVLEAAAGAE